MKDTPRLLDSTGQVLDDWEREILSAGTQVEPPPGIERIIYERIAGVPLALPPSPDPSGLTPSASAAMSGAAASPVATAVLGPLAASGVSPSLAAGLPAAASAAGWWGLCKSGLVGMAIGTATVGAAQVAQFATGSSDGTETSEMSGPEARSGGLPSPRTPNAGGGDGTACAAQRAEEVLEATRAPTDGSATVSNTADPTDSPRRGYEALAAGPQEPRAQHGTDTQSSPSSPGRSSESSGTLGLGVGVAAFASASNDVSPSARATSAPAPARARGPTDLLRETAWVARARAALRSGSPRTALELLVTAEHEFPSGQLAQEREALKVECLLQLGRSGEAAAIARDFLRAHPDSPHSDQIRSLYASE